MTDPRPRQHGLAASLTGADASLVDVIDSLVDKGVVLQGDVALGIAGIDLITLKLAALLVSAERLDTASRPVPEQRQAVHGPPSGMSAPAMPEPMAAGPTHVRPTAERVASDDDAPAPPAAPVPTRGGARPGAVAAAAWSRTATPVEVPPGRWDVDPDDVRRSVMKLVLTLVEVIRQLLERRAIRQMEADRLSDEEVERLGRSLHELEQTVRDLAAQAGLDVADLNLDLGPLGRLL